MIRLLPLSFVLLCLVGVVAGTSGCGGSTAGEPPSVQLLNVSYDPTRELWRDLNTRFIKRLRAETGEDVAIKQSHAGSSSQARAVIDGLDADVVTLALWSDVDAIRKRGLIKDDWQERFPNHSLAYFSTIVFVVRKGNPKAIKSWPDVVKPNVVVMTPNPKTSGNGKLSFLAAWGSVIQAGGSEQAAREFVTRLYKQTPVLETGARGATTTFAQRGIGDVHLTWENEAHLEVEESAGALEIVYPPQSIRAEPFVAVVDANADRKGTRAIAEKYLKFLYTDEGQETIAQHFYRPTDEAVLAKHADRFPKINLFSITAIATSWDAAQQKFFADGGVFDSIYQPSGSHAASGADR
ncbi:MAG TPA: sulfate ABC transporter substrate-binding protein [Planctomycetaceae bacterium]|nr:sulfate ABC transporter substrate-binding protein [Planctomycetaceae bacterium]